MEPQRKDRRTRKTRQLLRNALLALLKEKRYEEISVQDIIERADVARSTFYMHYLDKDDLLTGGQGIFAENLGQPLISHSSENLPSVFSSRLWFYHLQAQSPILRVIAKDSALDLAMKTLHDIIQRSVQESLQANSLIGHKGIPASVIVDYVAGALMTLIQWWFKHGMTYTPEQMDEIFRQLVVPGISSVLTRNRVPHEAH